MRRKDLTGEEEPSVIFLKATSYQNHMFSGSMPRTTCKAVSGAVDLTRAKLFLSKSVGVTMVAELSRHGCTGLPFFRHSLRGKSFETRWWSSGVRGNGSLQHEAAALQPLATLEPETM